MLNIEFSLDALFSAFEHMTTLSKLCMNVHSNIVYNGKKVEVIQTTNICFISDQAQYVCMLCGSNVTTLTFLSY